MPVYTVHAPRSYGTDVRTTPDRVVFVRDGFSIWAFLLGPVWLIWNRLWLALCGYIALQLAIEFALRFIHATQDTRFFVMFVIALLMGLEASTLRRWTLARRKWRQLDVVVARNREEAERRFFGRQPPLSAPVNSIHPMPRSSITPHDDAGFFPMPGSSQ
jgi:Protein of unknown function (DUF2628)